MASKTSAQVIIGGKVYTLSGYEKEDYLQKVAGYLNNRIAETQTLPDYPKLSGDMRAILLELNLADDYFKAKEQAERLEQEIEERDREIYDLKQELVSAQIAQEDRAKEYKELLLEKTRLETALSGKKTEEEK